MVTSILEAIVALLKSIPYFDKWFSKNEEKAEREKREKAREKMDKFKEDGRPRW